MSEHAQSSADHAGGHGGGSPVVMLSGKKFIFACAVVAAVVLWLGRSTALPTALLATEVFATVVSLFVFGSFQYQIP